MAFNFKLQLALAAGRLPAYGAPAGAEALCSVASAPAAPASTLGMTVSNGQCSVAARAGWTWVRTARIQ